MHLWPLALLVPAVGVLALALPIVLWLVQRAKSPFDDDHGREVINAAISFIILNVVLTLTIVGVALLPVLWIYGLVSVVRGAIAAGQGEYFRYPMTFRFLS